MRLASDVNKAKESFYAPGARILTVDDTRMNLIVVKELLKQTGVQIDTADSGRECLLLAEENKYNIIFLDIKMPEMDGIETLRRLLLLERNKNTPVIALTASDISETRNEYSKEGFYDSLSKPVDAEKLKGVILKYLPGELVRYMSAGKTDAVISDDETDEMLVIAGLDTAMGIQSCGTAQTFQKALKEFRITASERILEIEHYLLTENYHDYTIKVHALKSSARLVGAEKLSELARYLEECGDQENFGEIKLRNAELIEHYKELAAAIGTYIDEKENAHDRPVIECESLREALQTIYEFVEVFDFDSAESIMEMLEAYAIPEKIQEAVQKLKVLMADVARADIMRHITAMLEQTDSSKNDSIVIPDIDAESAVLALGGSVKEYSNILQVFTEDEKKRIQQMDECIRAENIELYTIYAHSLKSSAAIIGAMELSKMAEQLEKAGKEKNSEFIHENHDNFTLKTSLIIEDVTCFLQQQKGCESQEKEQGNKEFLYENLEKIVAALMEFELEIAEKALVRLDNMQWSEDISAILSETGQKIRAFDYEEAQLLVEKLLKMEEKKHE